MADRERLVQLVARLVDADFRSEEEADALLSELDASVPHPAVTDLIYHWEDSFDHEPTASEIVDRALGYRPFAL